MNPLSKAIAIAAQAHLNDVDKGGNAYILHPLRLMSHMHSDEEKMTAVLHCPTSACVRQIGVLD